MSEAYEHDGVRLRMRREFATDRLSEAEREVLRAHLPELMAELLQVMPEDETGSNRRWR